MEFPSAHWKILLSESVGEAERCKAVLCCELLTSTHRLTQNGGVPTFRVYGMLRCVALKIPRHPVTVLLVSCSNRYASLLRGCTAAVSAAPALPTGIEAEARTSLYKSDRFDKLWAERNSVLPCSTSATHSLTVYRFVNHTVSLFLISFLQKDTNATFRYDDVVWCANGTCNMTQPRSA
ncbi:hypothetical protein CBL_13946 [Carabus blaptoides fortunei]